MTSQKVPSNHHIDYKETAREATTGPYMGGLARLGYACKGLVYFVIGALAIQLVLGQGGTTTDQRGAIQTVATLPAGKVLLYIIVVGLVGFALWSVIQAVFDTESKGHKASGIVARVGYAITGISYAILGVGAFHFATNTGGVGKSNTQATQEWTALLLQLPFGVMLVILLGLIIIGVGVFLYVKAYQARFRQHLDMATVSFKLEKRLVFLGRFGYAALATVFVIIGIFLIVAALSHNPGRAKGLDAALAELIHHPLGPVWLGIVALGFVAYGVYSLVEARYRRIGRN